MRGASPTITTHLDRRAAVAGSDFVLNMVQIGGHDATLRDFEIPARYGLRQTIADTLGIGGIFRTLRTADHMLALGNEMAELCGPEAWLLNYTNPMAALCELVYKGTPTSNVVGLCHSVQFTIEMLSELVDVPESEVTFLSAGINHQAFILRFEHGGENLYPRLDERIAGDAELQRRVRVALYRRLGYFPTESSEHAAEYVPWFMGHDDEIDHYRIPGRRVHPPQRGEPRRVRARARRARGGRADRGQALERVRIHDRQLDGHRRAVGDLRQRAERGPDRRAAGGRVRRGPVSRRRHRRPADRRARTTRRSSPL